MLLQTVGVESWGRGIPPTRGTSAADANIRAIIVGEGHREGAVLQIGGIEGGGDGQDAGVGGIVGVGRLRGGARPWRRSQTGRRTVQAGTAVRPELFSAFSRDLLSHMRGAVCAARVI